MAAAHGIALVEMSRGDEREARLWLDRALEMNPKYTPSLNALGVLELGAGHVDDAGRLFVRALNVDNRDLDARVGVLAATLRRGNLAQATAMRDRLMKLDPSRPDLRALSLTLDRQLEGTRAYGPSDEGASS
jgi:tetratricopeptide (TPR) repeat protein